MRAGCVRSEDRAVLEAGTGLPVIRGVGGPPHARAYRQAMGSYRRTGRQSVVVVAAAAGGTIPESPAHGALTINSWRHCPASPSNAGTCSATVAGLESSWAAVRIGMLQARPITTLNTGGSSRGRDPALIRTAAGEWCPGAAGRVRQVSGKRAHAVVAPTRPTSWRSTDCQSWCKAAAGLSARMINSLGPSAPPDQHQQALFPLLSRMLTWMPSAQPAR